MTHIMIYKTHEKVPDRLLIIITAHHLATSLYPERTGGKRKTLVLCLIQIQDSENERCGVGMATASSEAAVRKI